MAPATRTRRRPSNAAEAPPPSPYKTSTTSKTTTTTTGKKKRDGGGDVEGEDGERKGRGPAADDKKKTAFVTVGTTRFDALVRAVDCPLFESALLSRGFNRLVVQAGAGGHKPERLLGLAKEEEEEEKKSKGSKKGSLTAAAAAAVAPTAATRFSGTTAKGLSVEFFDYAPSLKDRFAAADLVVTHAGAGSIFETLSMPPRPAANPAQEKKNNNPSSSSSSSPSSPAPPIPLIAVPNGALMHNHQAELASELEGRGLLVAATPETLAAVLARADFSRLRRYEAGGALGVVAAIDELSGRRRKGGSKKARKG